MDPMYSVSTVSSALTAALLLCYPISIKQVHPTVQIVICACLTTIGLLMIGNFFFPESKWTVYVSVLLSLITVVAPVLGAIVGLATAAGLVTNAIASQFVSSGTTFILTAMAVVVGMSSLFAYRELVLQWQLIAPPIVGGYLVALVPSSNDPIIFYSVWILAALASLGLHLRRRNVASWLERKQALAVHSKESQIVKVMRSANPNMSAVEYEALKVKLLEAVDGDQEQVDRVVFGGGLY